MDDSYANKAATAGGGQSAAATITATHTTSTPASANDSETLPKAAPGLHFDVANIHATNNLNVFPSSGDVINALSANAAFALAAVKSVTFMCTAPGQWWTNPRVAS